MFAEKLGLLAKLASHLYRFKMKNSDMIKAELIDYFVDDEKPGIISQKSEDLDINHNKQRDVTNTPVAGTKNDSSFGEAAKTGSPPVIQPAQILPKFGLPVEAYPNYRNYLFWFTLDSATLDKEILFRNTLCLAYARNRTVCAVLTLSMFFYLLLFHGYAVRWLSTILKTTFITSVLPAGVLWFAGNIITLAALAVVFRFVWTLLRQMFHIRLVLPLVLPNNVLHELELKDVIFYRLFVPEESLRPSYFAEMPPRVNENVAAAAGSLFRSSPTPAANDSFFNNLSAQRTPDLSFSSPSRYTPLQAPQLASNQQQLQNWKMPETPFSWLHLTSSAPKPQQQLQQMPSQLPRFMQGDYYNARQRQEQQTAEYNNNLSYQAWQQQQQQQSMLYNNSPYYAASVNNNNASLLYPSPTSFRTAARAPSPYTDFVSPDNINVADESMMSTSSTSSSASKRSRTPSCLLHEHEKFDSVDRENVYNTYGYPAVERAFDSLKQIHTISPSVFYSSQFLGRLSGNRGYYNAADQFDVPQTLNTLIQPSSMQNSSASPFGFLRNRRKQRTSSSGNAMDTLETLPPVVTNNLPFDGLSLSPDEIWTLLGIMPNQLHGFTQNLKHWLLITVVRPLDALVDECDQLILASVQSTEQELSSSSNPIMNTLQNFLTGRNAAANNLSIRMNPDISALRQALRAKPDEYRMLNNLIPFLDAFSSLRTSTSMPQVSNTSQAESIKYALQRIHLLSNAPGIMNNYAWDGSTVLSHDNSIQQTYAGIFNPATPGLFGSLNKPFNMPNTGVAGDPLVLYDTFRTFFDIIMAADPRSVVGSFSYHYVMPPNVGQATLMNSSRLQFPMLYQESGAVAGTAIAGGMPPPNFQVFYEGKFLQPERGRNNLFHAILLFLVLLRQRFEDGRGAVWLGSAGSHIFDVFRADYREFMESVLNDG